MEQSIAIKNGQTTLRYGQFFEVVRKDFLCSLFLNNS